jgi:hypothetical protein
VKLFFSPQHCKKKSRKKPFKKSHAPGHVDNRCAAEKTCDERVLVQPQQLRGAGRDAFGFLPGHQNHGKEEEKKKKKKNTQEKFAEERMLQRCSRDCALTLVK